MKLQQYNKATAAIVSGALVTVIGAFASVDVEVLGAAQTLLTAVLVWLAPNRA